jgi:hypothetical protein
LGKASRGPYTYCCIDRLRSTRSPTLPVNARGARTPAERHLCFLSFTINASRAAVTFGRGVSGGGWPTSGRCSAGFGGRGDVRQGGGEQLERGACLRSVGAGCSISGKARRSSRRARWQRRCARPRRGECQRADSKPSRPRLGERGTCRAKAPASTCRRRASTALPAHEPCAIAGRERARPERVPLVRGNRDGVSDRPGSWVRGAGFGERSQSPACNPVSTLRRPSESSKSRAVCRRARIAIRRRPVALHHDLTHSPGRHQR